MTPMGCPGIVRRSGGARAHGRRLSCANAQRAALRRRGMSACGAHGHRTEMEPGGFEPPSQSSGPVASTCVVVWFESRRRDGQRQPSLCPAAGEPPRHRARRRHAVTSPMIVISRPIGRQAGDRLPSQAARAYCGSAVIKSCVLFTRPARPSTRHKRNSTCPVETIRPQHAKESAGGPAMENSIAVSSPKPQRSFAPRPPEAHKERRERHGPLAASQGWVFRGWACPPLMTGDYRGVPGSPSHPPDHSAK